MHGDGGKGSGRRPMAIDDQKFQQQWEAIFGKKKHEHILARDKDSEVAEQRIHELDDKVGQLDGKR